MNYSVGFPYVKNIHYMEYGGRYHIEIEENDNTYDIWIYNPNYGVKMYAIGLVKDEMVNESNIFGIVLNNIEDFIKLYKEKYEDMEDE